VNNHLITIIGCGPGSRDYLTIAAVAAVAQAEVLIGPERLLALFPVAAAEKVASRANMAATLDLIASRLDRQSVTVLVTGDPGCYSLAKLVIKRFGRHQCRVIPGVSSVQLAFARLGLDWQDARIVSAHKEDPESDASLWHADKIAVLAGRERSLQWLHESVVEHGGEGRRIFVCENLTLENERIIEVDLPTLANAGAASRTIVLLVRRDLLE
jgi:cobalt-precorrin-7 (C5)-methyltransferase